MPGKPIEIRPVAAARELHDLNRVKNDDEP